MFPRAAIYFSNGDGPTLVAPMHENEFGIGYEQECILVLPKESSIAQFGEAVKQALFLYSVKPRDMRIYKKTDWPAFRASKRRSVTSFEREFTHMSVHFLNPTGAVARAEFGLTESGDRGIFCMFNPRSPGEEIGKTLISLKETFANILKAGIS